MPNILTRSLDFITGKAPKQVNRPPTGGGLFPLSMPLGWGTQQYIDAYGQVGWLYACVSVISIAVGEAQWKLYSKKTDGDMEEITKHPLLDLLAFANPFQTQQELIELSQCYDELVGEDFWYLARDGSGKPAEIWCLDPQRVSVIPSKTEYIAGYIYQGEAGQFMPIPRQDMIHVKQPNPGNPYRGLGRVQTIMSTLDAEKYRAQWNRNYFIEGASPGGTIEVPDTLTEETYQRLTKSWNEGHRGVAKAHRIAILEGGAKFHEVTVGLKDMDFGALSKVGMNTILGTFGTSLHILGIEETTNRSTAESSEYVFARWVIKPRLNRRKGKLNEVLVPQFGDNLYLDFVDPTPENKDFDLTKAERGYLSSLLTKNEARQVMGFDPTEDPSGDEFRQIPTGTLWGGLGGTLTETPKMLTEGESSTLGLTCLCQSFSDTTDPKVKGGEGSGNFGHEGRPGEVGGSGEGGGGDVSGESKFNAAQLSKVYPDNYDRFFLGKDEDMELQSATDELGQTSNSTSSPSTYREKPTLMDEYVAATGYGMNPAPNPERANELKLKLEELKQRKINLEAQRAKGDGEFKREVAAKLEGKPEVYVRLGDVPENGTSYNYRDSRFEEGVSVYKAIKVDKGLYYINSVDFLLTGPALIDRPLYEIKGDLIGHGSDGEPLLKVSSKTKPKVATIFHPVMGLADTGGKNAYRASLKAKEDSWREGKVLDQVKSSGLDSIPSNIPSGTDHVLSNNDMKRKNKQLITPDEVHWNEFVKRLTPREDKMTDWLKSFFKEQEKVVLENFNKANIGKSRVKVRMPDIFDANFWADMAAKRSLPLLEAMMDESGTAEAGKLGFSFNVHNPRVLEWLGVRTAKFGVNINQTTANAIAAQLKYGEEAGEGVYEISRRIMGVFDQASESRATMIARTEMVGSANRGSIEAYRQTGVVKKKRWISSQDEWTRRPPPDGNSAFDHWGANGEMVGLDEPFLNTGEPMDSPGDMSGSAGNLINCRCTVAPVLNTEERQASRCPHKLPDGRACAKLLGYNLHGDTKCPKCGNDVHLP